MKPSKGRYMAQKIKAQQPVDSTLGRQSMTGHRKIFDALTKALDDRNCHYRQIFDAAGGDDGNMFFRPDRITADGQRKLGRNDGRCGHRVNHQPNDLCILGAFQQGMRCQQLERSMERQGETGHFLEGNSVTRGETVVRKGHESCSFFMKHGLVDFIPVRAVGQEMAASWSGCGAIHAVHGNKKPFSTKPLAYFINRLILHTYYVLQDFFGSKGRLNRCEPAIA